MVVWLVSLMSEEKMNVKVYISEYDPFIFNIRDEKETRDMFGDSFVDDYEDKMTEIPKDLLNRFREISVLFWDLQREIEKYSK